MKPDFEDEIIKMGEGTFFEFPDYKKRSFRLTHFVKSTENEFYLPLSEFPGTEKFQDFFPLLTSKKMKRHFEVLHFV